MDHKVFISYSTKDKDIANSLCTILEEKGIKCWIAPRNIQEGQVYAGVIVNAITKSQVLIIVFSKNSNKSVGVLREIDCASQKNKVIIPFKIDKTTPKDEMAYYLSTLQWFHVRENIQRSIHELYEHVNSILKQKKGDHLIITRVNSYNSIDILAALELYNKRIPENERFESADIVRWLREDSKKNTYDDPRDHFFIAKQGENVLAFTLIHYYPIDELAFIAYLARKEKIKIKEENVTSLLFQEVARTFNEEISLKDCKAFLLEVDDPRSFHDSEDYDKALARIRLFCTIAQQTNYSLRALAFDYKQPLLNIPGNEQKGTEQSMILMYASREMNAVLTKEETIKILAFIYNKLYPESFSEVFEENIKYREYLSGFFDEQVIRVPERVMMLNARQLVVWMKK